MHNYVRIVVLFELIYEQSHNCDVAAESGLVLSFLHHHTFCASRTEILEAI